MSKDKANVKVPPKSVKKATPSVRQLSLADRLSQQVDRAHRRGLKVE